MRIVLDTNCLLHAVSNRSKYHCILTALQQGRYMLCCSNDILLEYEELLTRFYPKPIVEHVLGFIFYSPNTVIITPFFKWNLITSDPDDNKFVDCALNSGANYIVTNDKHFNILKKVDFPNVDIVDIDIFKKIILPEL